MGPRSAERSRRRSSRATAGTVESHHRWWSLEPAAGETLRAALERTIREAILGGALRAGVRLPASRSLARELGVSRGVVTDAYEQLASQGLLNVRPRFAPIVAQSGGDHGPPPSVWEPTRERVSPALRHDLAPWASDLNLFPLRRWAATAQRVARECDRRTLDYRDQSGEGALRAALADHLGLTRGTVADPEQVIVTQGTAQSVDLVLRLLRARGASRFAVEDPSDPLHQAQVKSAGLALVAQPTDADGLIVEELAAAAVLITPMHQYPTGAVLSGERRTALLRWARATDGLIIEDDYDGEFRYDHKPLRALQGLAPDLVLHLGSVSKSLAPALRLGWLVAPAALVDDVAREKRLLDGFSPPLDQLTLASFLRSGDYARHLRTARAAYRARHDRLLAALAAHLPEWEVSGIGAGVHVVLQLPLDVDDEAIAEEAWRSQIRVRPLSSFFVRQARASGLVIGYGRLHESKVASAVAELASIIRARLPNEAPRPRTTWGKPSHYPIAAAN